MLGPVSPTAPRDATATVVLVHGVRTSATMWRHQLTALEAAGIPAVAPDMPGHGTRRGEPFTVDGAVAAIDDAVRGARGPVVAVGLSMGGYLTLHWAARAARPPAAVVAASCSTRPRGPALGAYRRLAAAITRLPDGGAGVGDALAARFLPEQGRTDVSAGGMAPDVMGPVLSGLGAVDPLADLRAIDAPVWLVNGRWDHFRGEERRFLRACRNGRLVVVPGATHLVSLVRPVAFNRILLDVVAEVSGASAPRRAPHR